MEPILDYLDVNTFDIWTFEANQYLTNNRTDEHIIKVKSALELQIVISRREQINNNLSVTINPIVTIDDYDNGVNKDYWVRHVREIGDTKTIHDRVNLGYFNVFDAGLDSFFSLEQYILIHKDNEQFDFWFALKLSQFKSGIKYIPDFLNYQMQEVYNFDVVVFCEFLEVVILQYKDEFIDEKVCLITEKWILSQRVEISEKQDGVFNSNIEQYKKKGDYKTFLLKDVEFNPAYFKSDINESALHEFWQNLKLAGYIKDTKIDDFKALFLNTSINKDNRIVWNKSIKSLTEFVKALMNSNKIVGLSGVDHWFITMECFRGKKSQEIEFKSLYKPDSNDSSIKGNIELMVQTFCSKLE